MPELLPCERCKCLHRRDEPACPFCKAPSRSRGLGRTTLAGAVVLTATLSLGGKCGDQPEKQEQPLAAPPYGVGLTASPDPSPILDPSAAKARAEPSSKAPPPTSASASPQTPPKPSKK